MLEALMTKALWSELRDWSTPCHLALNYDYGDTATNMVINMKSDDPFSFIDGLTGKLNTRYKGMAVFEKWEKFQRKISSVSEDGQKDRIFFYGYACYNRFTPVIIFYYVTETGVQISINSDKPAANEMLAAVADITQKKLRKASDGPEA